MPDERFAQFLPSFNYELVDLNAVADEFIIQQSIGHYLKSTFLVLKHQNDKTFLMQFSKEIFIFVSKELDEVQKQSFLRSFVTHIFQAFGFQGEEFKELIKILPNMVETVAGNLYDQLIQEGMEKGMEKGEYKRNVIAIRNMTLKKFELSIIKDILNLPEKYIQQIQKELVLEPKIKAALKKKELPANIAKKGKVSEWLVEVIAALQEQK